MIQLQAMSMNYYIFANVDNDCKGAFPAELSFFFEQIGGFGDKSLVSQVETILDIDLSAFQNIDASEGEESDASYWQNIDAFEAVIDNLLDNIKSNPEYHKEVKFHPLNPVYGYSSDSTRMAEIKAAQQAYEDHPMYGYPNEGGYLTKGRIILDLENLKALLKCYRENGATKIKLDYG